MSFARPYKLPYKLHNPLAAQPGPAGLCRPWEGASERVALPPAPRSRQESPAGSAGFWSSGVTDQGEPLPLRHEAAARMPMGFGA